MNKAVSFFMAILALVVMIPTAVFHRNQIQVRPK